VPRSPVDDVLRRDVDRELDQRVDSLDAEAERVKAVIVTPGVATVGFVQPITIRMPGIAGKSIANAIAARELANLSRPKRSKR
jgi:hypothetical protein